MNSVPMEEERDVASPQLAPPDYPVEGEAASEQAKENEEAINEIVSAVEEQGTEETPSSVAAAAVATEAEGQSGSAHSSHNTSSHSAEANIQESNNSYEQNKENHETSNDEVSKSAELGGGYDHSVNVEVEVSNGHQSAMEEKKSEAASSSGHNYQQSEEPPVQNAGGGGGVLSLDIQSARSMVKANRHQAKEAPGSWKNKWADFNRL